MQMTEESGTQQLEIALAAVAPDQAQPCRGRFQYSLRSLMIFAALFVVCCSVGAVLYQKYLESRRFPRSFGGGSRVNSGRDEYPCIEMVCYRDGNGDLFYAAIEGYVSSDPNACSVSYCHALFGDDVFVEVNGNRIEYSDQKHLLALNPFGQMEEIALSPDECGVVCSGGMEATWEIALKHLYCRSGKMVNGVPDGHWTYSDSAGNLAYEGDYQNGKRNGKWTYYYRNGNRRAEIDYLQGKLHGEYKSFDEHGTLTKTVRWKGAHSVRDAIQTEGLMRWGGRTSTSSAGGSP
jgi:hypothetical protein